MKYELTVKDGKIRYLAKSGRDLVSCATSPDRAEWLMRNREITQDAVEGHPEYCVCAGGEYWFEGRWIAEKKRRRTKDIVCE